MPTKKKPQPSRRSHRWGVVLELAVIVERLALYAGDKKGREEAVRIQEQLNEEIQ